jgi:predicted GNAT superfamily acetyltransferase
MASSALSERELSAFRSRVQMTYCVKDLGGDSAIRANILRLNNENARETSPLDADKLDRMAATARVATIVVPGIAFLLAFDQGADYDSSNFIWFRERFDTFLYIDRVVVGEDHRRLGLGRLLYDDLFRRARHLGHQRVACEVNVRPGNPGSDAFHATLGFAEVGRGVSTDGAKSVRYLACSV